MQSQPTTFKRIERVHLPAIGKPDLLDYCERRDGRKACLKLNHRPIQMGSPQRVKEQFRKLARKRKASFDKDGCPVWLEEG